MTSLVFVVPAYRRFDLTRICLRQLRRACDTLEEGGMHATAVVVADDDNLKAADALGFAPLSRPNQPLGRKFNDGIEHACRLSADVVVPLGTDNWVDPAFVAASIPSDNRIVAHRLCALVDEWGGRLQRLRISYAGGDGIRFMPASLLEQVRFRPALEGRERAIDSSMHERIRRATGRGPLFDYRELHPLQVVGFQSLGVQLNAYRALKVAFADGPESRAPFHELAKVYPRQAVDEVRDLYARRLMRRGAIA